ncbi:hypothetical protein [Nocardia crassostreae]|uniref:hypothetical protein n=1 Tax=Nocardia crassostreae TaxID=53428 RepID=UPI0012F88A28|nr:hypothetical protein [Nocardia crassostreae]
MRGAGKSQLAASYARAKINAGCGVVGWINAETYGSLTTDLAAFADDLNVADPGGDMMTSIGNLTRHLATLRGDALLVFDNAVDPVVLRRFLPATGTQVIITSTERSFTELAEPIAVDRYIRPESTTYLRKRTNLDDVRGAEAVAEELGDLPLALASAAAMIDSRGLRYDEYRELLRDSAVADFMPLRDAQEYPHSTAAALVLDLRTVVGDEPTTLRGRLLGAISLLSAEGVNRKYLHGLATPDTGVDAIEQALRECVAGSILTWSHNRDAVIMHRLMARVVKEQARCDAYFQSLAVATVNLIRSQQFDRADGWCRRHEGIEQANHGETIWQAMREFGMV